MAGILSRILEKSCPTFIMGQRRLIAKTAAIQDDKVERKMGKEARKEERREMYIFTFWVMLKFEPAIA